MNLPIYSEPVGGVQGVKKIIAIASGKGGVGKSTVAVALAAALVRQGLKVGLLDADLYGPSVRHMVGEVPSPSQEGEVIVPIEVAGMKVMSMAYFCRPEEGAAVRAPIATGILKQFISKVIWGELDLLIVDFPPGTGDVQLTVVQELSITAAVMVTTPQKVALIDVAKAADLFHRVRVPICGVVENMSGGLFGAGGGEKIAAELQVPLLAQIALDSEICRLGDEGELATAELVTFDRLAKQVVGALPVAAKRWNLEWRELPDGICAGLAEGGPLRLVALGRSGDAELHLAWSDGTLLALQLSELQRSCGCAACQQLQEVDSNVGAKRVRSMGDYGLQIEFTSGCSNGIYELEKLHALVGC